MTRAARRTIVVVVVLAVCGGGAVAFSRSSVGTALLKSRAHFTSVERDPRVLYEPGMKEQAELTAAHLPAAIGLVEDQQSLPMIKPFRVYVCNSQDSFNAYMAAPKGSTARGVKVGNSIFLSPECFSSWRGDTHAEVLAHELSHLQLYQRIGHLRYLWNLPTWFVEGLAVTVSGGGGEGVTAPEARGAILSGYHFAPDDRGGWLRPKRAADYGIDTFMFYRQSELFVTYIRDRHPRAFERFLLDLQEGGRRTFAAAFGEAFGKDVAGMWEEFVESLSGGAPAPAREGPERRGSGTNARRGA
jgi:hypothetical protein